MQKFKIFNIVVATIISSIFLNTTKAMETANNTKMKIEEEMKIGKERFAQGPTEEIYDKDKKWLSKINCTENIPEAFKTILKESNKLNSLPIEKFINFYYRFLCDETKSPEEFIKNVNGGNSKKLTERGVIEKLLMNEITERQNLNNQAMVTNTGKIGMLVLCDILERMEPKHNFAGLMQQEFELNNPKFASFILDVLKCYAVNFWIISHGVLRNGYIKTMVSKNPSQFEGYLPITNSYTYELTNKISCEDRYIVFNDFCKKYEEALVEFTLFLKECNEKLLNLIKYTYLVDKTKDINEAKKIVDKFIEETKPKVKNLFIVKNENNLEKLKNENDLNKLKNKSNLDKLKNSFRKCLTLTIEDKNQQEIFKFFTKQREDFPIIDVKDMVTHHFEKYINTANPFSVNYPAWDISNNVEDSYKNILIAIANSLKSVATSLKNNLFGRGTHTTTIFNMPGGIQRKLESPDQSLYERMFINCILRPERKTDNFNENAVLIQCNPNMSMNAEEIEKINANCPNPLEEKPPELK